MSFSSLFTNPNRPSEVKDEEAQRKFIDTLLSYRTRETLYAVATVWAVFLGMVFTFVLTVGLALKIPSLIHAGW